MSLKISIMSVGRFYSLNAHDSNKNPVVVVFEILEVGWFPSPVDADKNIRGAKVRFLDGVEDVINAITLEFATEVATPWHHKLYKWAESLGSIALLDIAFPKEQYTLLWFPPSKDSAIPENVAGEECAKGSYRLLMFAQLAFRKYALKEGIYVVECKGYRLDTFKKS
jgi:hypothetical protein